MAQRQKIKIGDFESILKLKKELTKMKEGVFYNSTFGIFELYFIYTKVQKYSFFIQNKEEDLLNKYKIKNEYKNIKNKTLFFEKIKIITDKIGSKSKAKYKAQVSLFDLETLDETFGLKIEDKNQLEIREKERQKRKEREEAAILNQILLAHGIFSKDKQKEITQSKNIFKIYIKNIDLDNITLFPVEDRYYNNRSIIIKKYANTYFPSVVNFFIRKKFSYEGYHFYIIYEKTDIITFFVKIIKEYYDFYNLSAQLRKEQKEKILDFVTTFFEKIKSSDGEKNLKKNMDRIIQKSNCQKCGSASSLFNVMFSNVHIKVSMSSLGLNELYLENILKYSDIIEIKCYECGNPLLKNNDLKSKIEEKRSLLGEEIWIDPLTGKPLLDQMEETEVIVKYDLMEIEVEFDLTNILHPKLSYSKILNTGKVIGWKHIESGKNFSFYK